MKNKSKTIKKIFFSFLTITLVGLFPSCKQENSTIENKTVVSQDSTKVVWAELVESKTILIKPESWEDDYWNSVNKNMDKNKLFNTMVDAVLSGKKQAYDLFTDSLLTIEQVKEKLANNGNAGKKINAEDLSMIRMREKWFFDDAKFKLEKQVTRIDLLLKKLDETGEYVGDKALFYVNLN